jgi:hypothetical protein
VEASTIGSNLPTAEDLQFAGTNIGGTEEQFGPARRLPEMIEMDTVVQNHAQGFQFQGLNS